MRAKVNRALGKIGRFEKALMGGFFMVMTLMVFVQITIRWCGLRSFSWLEEFAQYVYICVVMVGAANGVTDDSLMKVRLFESILPKAACRIIGVISGLLCSGIAFYMASISYQTVKKMFQLHAKTSVLGWPVWFFYAVMAVAFVGMGVRFLLRIIFPPMEEKDKPNTPAKAQ
ncbi:MULTISPECIES: TRAP transporter small permease [Anaerotruncus]|uniref:TRAP transporter small permease n=1 Tax=Anaerotruncus TaxID=244127 RepID=UPI000830A2C3|nr:MULTISPECIES: TRAP transporter small permease [Anaerotruncus]RGX56711.1 TRAP transporter small permease [Anaerotruncus sp. AF02-27]